MRIITTVILFLTLVPGFAYAIEPHEGYVEVRGGRIWYKVFGSGPATPLVVVHGGPGGRSCVYFKAYQQLAPERPIIFFDQLESGMSDKPNDTTLWKLPYFVEQLDLLRKELELESFHLLGNSWGAAIAIEYLLNVNAGEVASIIFSGPLLSTPQWIADSKVLLSRMPRSVLDTILKYEELEEYSAPAYLGATNKYYANYLTRAQWPPAKAEECLGVPPSNSTIYNYMWGPTEFKVTGTLINFDRTNLLPNLKLPVLFIAGEFDEVLPETIAQYQSSVPGSKSVIVPGSGHSKTSDNPDFFIRAIGEFISDVDSANFK